MKRLKVIIPYLDLQLNRKVLEDEEIEVPDKRAEELLKHPKNIVTIVEIETSDFLKSLKTSAQVRNWNFRFPA